MKTFLLLVTAAITMSCTHVTSPAPIGPIPDNRQLEWQKMETYAFIHLGLNTFNDMEWGYGNTPASTFAPSALDCEQWVRILKTAGMKGVMLTAKHHDGFCLWPSKYTEYSVKNSPWQNGKGDMVGELSEACRKYGLKFGIYLSPWDRNHAEYGREEYREYFHNQMKELLTNYGPLFEYWFDGANGGDGWYGGADEKRSIDPKTYYDYESARKTINELQPEAVIFGGTCADIRWIGNEEGFAGQTNWSTVKGNGDEFTNDFTHGEADGDNWLPGECDVSIRPGWFYHQKEDHQVKSLSQMVDIYYSSVGRNANLIINFPVDKSGRIPASDSARIIEWRQTVDADLDLNLLKDASAEAGNIRGNSRKFGVAKVSDGDWDTYWATDDGVNTSELTFTFKKKTDVNRLLLQEYIPLGQRVGRFVIEYLDNGKWLPVETSEQTMTIGYKRIIRFRTVAADGLRVRFTESKGPLCICNAEAYNAPVLLEEPRITRDADGRITIKAADPDAIIRYTTDGSEPDSSSPVYGATFDFPHKGAVKSAAYTIRGSHSAISCEVFDIPCGNFTAKGMDATEAAKMFDGNIETAAYLPETKPYDLIIDLGARHTLTGFSYTPDQNRWGSGIVTRYKFYIDGKLVASGEFSNIVNNPVKQTIKFSPAAGRQIRFKADRLASGDRTGIAELSVITAE